VVERYMFMSVVELSSSLRPSRT